MEKVQGLRRNQALLNVCSGCQSGCARTESCAFNVWWLLLINHQFLLPPEFEISKQMSANSGLRGTRKNGFSSTVSAGVRVLSEVPLVFSICYYSGVATPADTPKKRGINTEINCTHV